MKSHDNMNITFIGGGNMAGALIAGLAGRLGASGKIHVVDPNPAQLAPLAARYGCSGAPAIDAAAASSEVIVLAVKPQQMRAVAAQLLPYLSKYLLPSSSAPGSASGAAPVLVSIAAGIGGADLSRWLGGYGAIVRAMPNTPALIGQGITGMVALPGVSAAHRDAADAVLQAVGPTVWLDDEALIDAVTAVSGSGPAYVFYFIEAITEAACELGLTAAQGKQLALATFAGATALAAQSDDAVGVLRERVTSKGGTTHAALQSMQAAGVKQAIVAAVKAAAARGRQLGEELGRD